MTLIDFKLVFELDNKKLTQHLPLTAKSDGDEERCDERGE